MSRKVQYYVLGLKTKIMAAAPVSIPPLRWIPVPPFNTEPKPAAIRNVKIATWNALAQSLIKRDIYPHASTKALRVAHRRDLHEQWTRQLDADIMCLQECDHVPTTWTPVLDQLGYRFVHSNRDAGMHGLAVAWKHADWRCARFQVVPLDVNPLKDLPSEPAVVTLRDGDDVVDEKAVPVDGTGGEEPGRNPTLEEAMRKLRTSSKAENGRGPKLSTVDPDLVLFPTTKNIALLVDLEHRETKKRMLIATAHLYWIPRGAYVRARQLAVIHKALERFSAGTPEGTIKLVAGDFNALTERPEYSLVTGHPLSDHLRARLADIPAATNFRSIPATTPPPCAIDFTNLPDPKPEELERLFSQEAGFTKWRSAYAGYADLPNSNAAEEGQQREDAWKEPVWTTYTPGFHGTLDYIFAVERPGGEDAGTGVHVRSLIAMPSTASILPGMPNDEHPSDHAPLMALVDLE